MKYTCTSCKKAVALKLDPDYGSSGIWCSNCGIMLDPKENLNFPDSVCGLIEGWNWLWDLANSNPRDINKKHFNEVYRNMSLYMTYVIDQYYDCKLIDHKSWLEGKEYWSSYNCGIID
jgi:DNA-directed RNA polymerase subunit RPC12/RpoP